MGRSHVWAHVVRAGVTNAAKQTLAGLFMGIKHLVHKAAAHEIGVAHDTADCRTLSCL